MKPETIRAHITKAAIEFGRHEAAIRQYRLLARRCTEQDKGDVLGDNATAPCWMQCLDNPDSTSLEFCKACQSRVDARPKMLIDRKARQRAKERIVRLVKALDRVGATQ